MDGVQWIEGLLHLPDALLYFFLFAFSLLENILPPVPGDAIVVFGGYLAGLGRLSLPIAFVMVTLGAWSGFMCYYALGRWLGRQGVHDWLARVVRPEALERAEDWLRRRGLVVVLANRLLTGARSVISLAAGYVGLNAVSVGLLALVGSLLWNVLLVGAGYTIGEEWERALELLSTYNRVVLAVLGLAAATLIARYVWRGRRRDNARRQGPPDAPPSEPGAPIS